MSAAAAHARPNFEIGQTSARAGDVVRFSITGVDGHVVYYVEAGDRGVLDTLSHGDVFGTFTMPDLGDGPRSVVVEAEMWWYDSERRVTRRLEYLGRALPAPDPPSAPAAAPAAAPEGAAPAPSVAPAPPDRAAAAPDANGNPARGPRRSRGRRGTEAPRHAGRGAARRGGERGKRGPRARHAERKRRARRTGRRKRRLLHGIPAHLKGDRVGGERESLPSLNALSPQGAAPVVTGAIDSHAAGIAIVVPGLLGLAALSLAGTAVLRRRRLHARPRRR